MPSSQISSQMLLQVFHPSVLKTRLTHAKDKHMMSRIVKHLKCCTLGRLLTANGEPDREVIKKLVFVIISTSFLFEYVPFNPSHRAFLN